MTLRMNLTVERYFMGLEEALSRLPGILDRYEDNTLEEELRDEYRSQMEWMLRVRPDVLVRADEEGNGPEVRARMAAFNSGFDALRARVIASMGVEVEGDP